MADLNPAGGLILVVDDEPMVLRAVTTALAIAGFRVIVAENGVAGLEAYLLAPKDIRLVLADVVMPFMGGLEMSEQIRRLDADAKILLMTGYSDAVLLSLPGSKFPLIRKPFLQDDLIRAVRANMSPPAVGA